MPTNTLVHLWIIHSDRTALETVHLRQVEEAVVETNLSGFRGILRHAIARGQESVYSMCLVRLLKALRRG